MITKKPKVVHMITEKQKTCFTIVLFIFVGFIIYANSLEVPFIFDDEHNIKNPNLKVENLSYRELKNALAEGTLRNRPISNASFAINYYFGDYKVQGYHLVNIVIHVSAAIFLFLLVKLTLCFSSNQIYQHKNAIAFFTGLLWLTHPLATQSVTYIVQRMNSMAAMFYVLSLLCYVMARREQLSISDRKRNWLTSLFYFLGFGVSALLALGSKEIAATLPIVVFLFEWYFIQNLSFSWIRKKAFWLLGTVSLIIIVLYFYTDGHLIRTFMSASGRDFTTWERVLTQFRVVVHYIGLIFYPHSSRLVFDYNIPFSTSFISPITTLISFLFLSFLFCFAVLIARRERLISFCILWFFINLAIESSIINLELVFEHRTYLPSMFLVLVVPALIFRFVKYSFVNSLILIVIICSFSLWTAERNKIWMDPETFWKDSLAKYPDNFRAHHNLGSVYFDKGEFELAEKHVRRSLDLNPKKIHEVYNTLGVILYRRGDLEQAEENFKKSIKAWRRFPIAIKNLGGFYFAEKRYADVVAHYKEALKYAKTSRLSNESLLYFGLSLLRTGEIEESYKFLKSAYDRDKQSLDIVLSLANNRLAAGDKKEAEKYYELVLKKNHHSPEANYNLASIYAEKNLIDKALIHYRRAALSKPEYFPVNYNYGNLLLKIGQLDMAENQYNILLNDSKMLPDTLNNLGLVRVHSGDYSEAIKLFEMAGFLDGSHKTANLNAGLARELLKER